MDTLDITFEFDGLKWETIDVVASPNSTKTSDDGKTYSLKDYFNESWADMAGTILDRNEDDWQQVAWYKDMAEGKIFPAGTQIIVRGAYIEGSWSGYETPEYDEEVLWNEEEQIILPSDGERLQKKMISHAKRFIARSGGPCTYCKTDWIDPNPKSEGQKRKLCQKCAEKVTKHEQAIANDPLYDLRRNALGEWNRNTDYTDQERKWAILLTKNEEELRNIALRHKESYDSWLLMW